MHTKALYDHLNLIRSKERIMAHSYANEKLQIKIFSHLIGAYSIIGPEPHRRHRFIEFESIGNSAEIADTAIIPLRSLPSYNSYKADRLRIS